MGGSEFARDPLVALREGDHGPFEGFVRSHARILVAFFRRQGARPEEAEDLTQEVFLKLYRDAARYRQEERLLAFAFRIARNLWIDSRRRLAAAPVPGLLDPSAEVDAGLAPGAGLEEGERGERLERSVRRLSPEHRAVFELCVIEGLSYGEIALLLGVPRGTVKSRMFYAVRALRSALGDLLEERT